VPDPVKKTWNRWTQERAAVFAAEYGHTPNKELAARLGVTVEALHTRAKQEGLSQKKHRWTVGKERVLRRMHREGYSDAEIGVELGLAPESIRDRRLRLGLDAFYSDRKRQKVATNTRRQLKRAGVKTLKDLRNRARAEFAARYGLPTDLPARAVQIVLALLDGPATQAEIGRRIGANFRNRHLNAHAGSHGKSCLQVLRERGLVCYDPRYTSGPNGALRLPGVYMLSGVALRMLASRAQEATRHVG
jgi:hypothetical protein